MRNKNVSRVNPLDFHCRLESTDCVRRILPLVSLLLIWAAAQSRAWVKARKWIPSLTDHFSSGRPWKCRKNSYFQGFGEHPPFAAGMAFCPRESIHLGCSPRAIGSQPHLYRGKYFDLLKEITNFLLLDGFYGLHLDGRSSFMWQDRVRRVEN